MEIRSLAACSSSLKTATRRLTDHGLPVSGDIPVCMQQSGSRESFCSHCCTQIGLDSSHRTERSFQSTQGAGRERDPGNEVVTECCIRE